MSEHIVLPLPVVCHFQMTVVYYHEFSKIWQTAIQKICFIHDA